jgi:hypothetical protein
MSKETGCKSCKQTGPGSFQIGGIILGSYMLFASIYGTIEIIKHIINLFK